MLDRKAVGREASHTRVGASPIWALKIFIVVPEVGLEPTHGCPYRILSPTRLPFHHSGDE